MTIDPQEPQPLGADGTQEFPSSKLKDLAPADGGATEAQVESTAASSAGDVSHTLIAGRYQLLKRIGEGGMGTVWMAEQREPVRRLVAVKMIKAGMDSKGVLARFEAERQALAIMDHPNIARILDGGVAETGAPFFVMDLVHGVPITEFCDQRRLTPQQRLQLFIPVCQAIQHAHQKGVIHRDIKPSNVLVTLVDDRPVPRVIDFGVAKATGPALTDKTLNTGFAVVGTPQYMSPEQASFNELDVDTRSDVYSLGVLLYELLAGSPPFQQQELAKAGYLEILRIIREDEPPRPSTKLSSADGLPSLSANRGTEPQTLTNLLRNELDWIVMKALEKDRGRRYESASSFAADIDRYLTGEAVLAHPPSRTYRVQKFLRHNRGPVVAVSLIGAALLTGFLGTLIGMVSANRERRVANEAQAATEEANRELKVANDALEKSFLRETARFELARQAIRLFHGEVSEDLLLKESRFKDLRNRLLRGAATFYSRLETLLMEQTDPASQAALGQAYLELGDLTAKIGNKPAALAVHEKGLAVHRTLATAPDANLAARVNVARSLSAVGMLLQETGQFDAAIKAWEEGREITDNLQTSGIVSAETLAGLGAFRVQIGHLRSNTGKKESAIQSYQLGLEVLQRAVTENPTLTQSLREMAFAHDGLGAVYVDTGRPQLALQEFEASLAIRESLAEQHSEQPGFAQDTAKSYSNIGLVQGTLGRPQDQLTSYYKARDILQRLFEENPAVSEIKRDLASSYDNIGYFNLHLGSLSDALAGFARAVEIQSELVADNPDVVEYRGHLARLHNNVGATLGRTDMAAALPEFQRALAVQQAIAERFPTLTRYRSELAQSHQNVGLVQRQLGEMDAALAEYREAITLLERLVVDNPAVIQYRVDLAGNHNNIAVVMKLTDRSADAVGALATAIDIQERLVLESPDVAYLQRELGRSLNNLADIHVTSGELPQALVAYRRSREIHEHLVKASPTVTDYRNGLGYTLSGLGRSLMKSKSNAEAVECFREAIAQRLQLPALSSGAQYDMASNHASLASLSNDADSGLKPDDGSREIAAAFSALERAIKLGFRDASVLAQDANFGPFRDREEFKTLMKQVESVAQPVKP